MSTGHQYFSQRAPQGSHQSCGKAIVWDSGDLAISTVGGILLYKNQEQLGIVLNFCTQTKICSEQVLFFTMCICSTQSNGIPILIEMNRTHSPIKIRNAYINMNSIAMGTDWWVARNLKINTIGTTKQSPKKSLQTILEMCFVSQQTAKYRQVG